MIKSFDIAWCLKRLRLIRLNAPQLSCNTPRTRTLRLLCMSSWSNHSGTSFDVWCGSLVRLVGRGVGKWFVRVVEALPFCFLCLLVNECLDLMRVLLFGLSMCQPFAVGERNVVESLSRLARHGVSEGRHLVEGATDVELALDSVIRAVEVLNQASRSRLWLRLRRHKRYFGHVLHSAYITCLL